MGILSSLFPPKKLLTPEEEQLIMQAIQAGEKQTSGEIRVYMEPRCKYVDPLDRAVEIFYSLKMNETAEKNAVLVYIAFKDHQLAVYGDEGIHQKTGQQFWREAVKQMLKDFNKDNYAAGIAGVVSAIGDALHTYFPYDGNTDKNELPDNIVFGK
jgi:uncharacterized membrane protein